MKLVHLVYVHGFQGDDTTFQSFPTDLQQHLSEQIPKHLDIQIQTSLYPTYRSVKPISFATKNFLEWLTTQPPGPVILLGHSMGGLLAADAATDPSNNPDKFPGAKPSRIVGMIAFDTPYLGMHPHVVISGIASLMPKDDGKKKKTEGEMNDHPEVNIVDGKVTDDWEAFKNNTNAHSRPTSIASASQSSARRLSPTPTPNSPPPSYASSPPRSPSPSVGLPASPLVDRALSFLSSHSNDPLVRWARKHADDPFSASKRWVTERFQFGSCMFDPSGLKDRYSQLVGWQGGLWVNYWTQTLTKPAIKGGDTREAISDDLAAKQDIAENDVALLESGITDDRPPSGPSTPSQSTVDPSPLPPPLPPRPSLPIQTAPTKSEAAAVDKAERKAIKDREKAQKQTEKDREKELKKLRKQREADAKSADKAEKDKNKVKGGHHFIVLPTGLGQVLGGGEKWEKVLIGGVDDEVAAHCGLFIRGQNLDYDGLVERVGKKVLGWCEGL